MCIILSYVVTSVISRLNSFMVQSICIHRICILPSYKPLDLVAATLPES